MYSHEFIANGSEEKEPEISLLKEIKLGVQLFEITGNELNFESKKNVLRIIEELELMDRSDKDEWNAKVHALFSAVGSFDASEFASSSGKHPKLTVLESIQQLYNKEK